MAKIILKAIKNEDKISANGKPYIRCSIKTIDKNGNEIWLNGFGNETTKSWVKEQEVELDVYEEEYNGKKSWKFRDVKEISILGELAKINEKLDLLLTTKNL